MGAIYVSPFSCNIELYIILVICAVLFLLKAYQLLWSVLNFWPFLAETEFPSECGLRGIMNFAISQNFWALIVTFPKTNKHTDNINSNVILIFSVCTARTKLLTDFSTKIVNRRTSTHFIYDSWSLPTSEYHLTLHSSSQTKISIYDCWGLKPDLKRQKRENLNLVQGSKL